MVVLIRLEDFLAGAAEAAVEFLKVDIAGDRGELFGLGI